MLGFSLSKSRWRLLSISGVLLLVATAAGGYWLYQYSKESQLLRADPDMLAQTGLMSFAVSHGKSVFEGNCASCHGADAKGDATRGVPNLADNDWLYGSGRVSEIQQTVRYGIRAQDPRGRDQADMPAFAQAIPYTREKLPPLSPDDVSDIVQFLLSQTKRATDISAVERGGKIFKTSAACWDCHGDDGRGDDAIGSSNLTDNIWLFGNGSASDITNSIERGHRGVCPAWVTRISAANILEVSLYLYSLSHAVGERSQ